MKQAHALALKGLGILVVFVLIMLAARQFHLSDYMTPARIEGWLTKAGLFAPVVLIATMALTVVVSPLPGLPLNIIAGSFFGPSLGTLYAALGALLGADLSFLIARFLGRTFMERVIRGHVNFCRTCSDKLLTRIVFFARLVPVVSFDIVSYGAGLTKMSLTKFSLATFFGTLPATFFYAEFGSAIIANPGIAVIGGVLMVGMFFLLPRWIERYDILGMRKHFQHGRRSVQMENAQIEVE